jgi:hypothetical protein
MGFVSCKLTKADETPIFLAFCDCPAFLQLTKVLFIMGPTDETSPNALSIPYFFFFQPQLTKPPFFTPHSPFELVSSVNVSC